MKNNCLCLSSALNNIQNAVQQISNHRKLNNITDPYSSLGLIEKELIDLTKDLQEIVKETER